MRLRLARKIVTMMWNGESYHSDKTRMAALKSVNRARKRADYHWLPALSDKMRDFLKRIGSAGRLEESSWNDIGGSND